MQPRCQQYRGGLPCQQRPSCRQRRLDFIGGTASIARLVAREQQRIAVVRSVRGARVVRDHRLVRCGGAVCESKRRNLSIMLGQLGLARTEDGHQICPAFRWPQRKASQKEYDATRHVTPQGKARRKRYEATLQGDAKRVLVRW